MSLFGKKVCVNCGKECGMFGRTSTRDEKVLCSDCVKLAGNEFDSYKHTYKQYLALVERYNENEKVLHEFNIDKAYYGRIFIDTSKKQIAFTKRYMINSNNMYKEHPHIYDIKDLVFFTQGYEIKKQDSSILGTTVYIDMLTTMVFEDRFAPCPLSGVVEDNRKVEIKGIFKKSVEGFYTQSDLEVSVLANDILIEKGLETPEPMKNGDKIESLDSYAPWFKMMFDLEKRRILEKKFVDSVLENLVKNTDIINSVCLPSQIRTRFGA